MDLTKQIPICLICITACAFLAFQTTSAHAQTSTPSHERSLSNTAEDTAQAPHTEDALSRRRSKKLYQWLLLSTLFVLSTFFFIVLIWSTLRMTRAQRRYLKIGKKNPPTEYIDIWSKHKIQIEPPDPPADKNRIDND